MNKVILLLSLSILLGFGLLVCVWSLAAKLLGRELKLVWTRYLVWFVIIPPLVIPLVLGRGAFQLAIFALSMFCFKEFSNAIGIWKDRRLMFMCYSILICIYLTVFGRLYGLYQLMPLFSFAFILTIPLQLREYEHMTQKTCLAILGIIYFGWFLSHLAYLRNYANGIGYIFFLTVVVESNDAFGYLWGSLLGRHKLISKISPNKTVEGAVGAFFSAIGIGFLVSFTVPHISRFHILVLSVMISVCGLCGDLIISFIKRDLHIKDMGNLIPGHGGLIDRFDSIIFTAPLYFHFIRYFYE